MYSFYFNFIKIIETNFYGPANRPFSNVSHTLKRLYILQLLKWRGLQMLVQSSWLMIFTSSIYLLISCLQLTSTFVNLSVSFFSFVCHCFIHFEALLLGECTFRIPMGVFCWLFYHYRMSFFILMIVLSLYCLILLT